VKAFLLAGLLASASLAARAQTYYLDLTNQTLSVPGRAVAVEQVLDGRTGHQPIGIVYRGLGSKSAAVAFRQGLETELTTFVQVQLPARPTDHAIVLCLRSLHIGETMGGAKEQATAEMTADVYAHLFDGYSFRAQRGRARQRMWLRNHRPPSRPPGPVAEPVAEPIGLVRLARRRQLTGPDAGRAAHRCPRDTGGGWPSRSGHPARSLRRGLYQQFEQFLTNRPNPLTAFVVGTIRRRNRSKRATLQWRNVVQVRPLVPNGTAGRTVPTGLWGFSDG